jgi:hypothetical protein
VTCSGWRALGRVVPPERATAEAWREPLAREAVGGSLASGARGGGRRRGGVSGPEHLGVHLPLAAQLVA